MGQIMGAYLVGAGFSWRASFKSPVGPQVLFWLSPDRRFYKIINGLGVGLFIIGWKILQWGLDCYFVAFSVGQPGLGEGDDLSLPEAGEPAGSGNSCCCITKKCGERAVFFAVILIRCIPHGMPGAQAAKHGFYVPARNGCCSSG